MVLNLRQVEAFCAIVQFGSFSAAAEALATTQPAISTRIRQLEQELGVRLFETSSRRAALTPKGRYFVQHAEALLSMARSVQKEMGGKPHIAGQVRLGVVDTVAITWLADFIQLVRDIYPDVVLELDISLTRVIWEKLEKGAVDMILVPGPLQLPGISYRNLGRISLSWVASPKLDLPSGLLTSKQLAAYPMISLSSASVLFQLIDRWFTESNLKVNWANHCSSLNIVASLTVAGLGISLLPSLMLEGDGQNGLIELCVEPKVPDLWFYAVYHSMFQTPLFDEVAKLAEKASTFRDKGQQPG